MSLMHIRNKRGHTIEHWGAPAGISAQEKKCPLR